MSLLVDVFLEPAKAFTALRERPSFLLPLALLAVGSSLFATLYFLRVDPAWFAGYQEAQLLASGREMSEQELEAARRMIPGTGVLAAISAIGGLVGVAFVSVLMALYYLLAGKVLGREVSFRHGLALTSWAGMPGVLAIVASLVALFTTASSQVPIESLQVLNLDPLLLQLDPSHPASRLAKSFNLTAIWSVALAAIGWRTWSRGGWGEALAVALLPLALIYGVMALFTLL